MAADNIFGLPVPPPPPGVDTNLAETKPGAVPPIDPRAAGAAPHESRRARSCHSVIDPLGFALENFDAIGGWRTVDESGKPVDASGTTVSGATIEGLAGLRALLLEQPEQFPRTVTEKLLAYALGRRLEYYDRPAVRKIVRDAAAQRLPLVVADSRDREESRVPDAGDPRRRRTEPRRSNDDILTDEIAAAAHRPAGARRDARAAVPRRDGARVLAARARRREAGAPVPDLLRAERHGDGVLDAEGRRAAPSSCRRSSSRWRRSGIRCWCSRASRRTGTTSTPARPDRS